MLCNIRDRTHSLLRNKHVNIMNCNWHTLVIGNNVKTNWLLTDNASIYITKKSFKTKTVTCLLLPSSLVTGCLQRGRASCWNLLFPIWWTRTSWSIVVSRPPQRCSLGWLTCWPNLARHSPLSSAPGCFVFTQVRTALKSLSQKSISQITFHYMMAECKLAY